MIMSTQAFIKYFGISYAKDVLSVAGTEKCVVLNDDGLGRIVIDLKDLNRFVESHTSTD